MFDALPDVFVPRKIPTQSRRHTPKVLLSVTLARPEKKEGVGFYDGKTEMLRCAKNVVAKRGSKYHKRGSTYQQDTNLTSQMFHMQLTKNIFPAIKKKQSLLTKSERFYQQLISKNSDYSLPEGSKYADLYLQKDNAPTHCRINKRLSALIRKAGGRNVQNGVYFVPKVRLRYQPPNSQDLNVMDLGCFTKL